METLKFKTNIKCGGCIAAVAPYLDKLSAIEKWDVDIQDPDKVLTINSKSEINSQQLIDTLKDVGYSAEEIQTIG